jgi:hypothetical protein
MVEMLAMQEQLPANVSSDRANARPRALDKDPATRASNRFVADGRRSAALSD